MKNRRAIIAVVAMNFVALLFILVEKGSAKGESVAPVLQCRVLELIDGSGTIRARLNVEPTGEVVLRLRDETGTIRVKLGASRNGSGFVLLNDSTEVGAQLAASSTGTFLKLMDNGKQRVISP